MWILLFLAPMLLAYPANASPNRRLQPERRIASQEMRRLRLAGGGAGREGAPGRTAAMTAAMGRGGRRALNTLANLVTLTAGLVALVIVIGIAFVVLEANKDNAIVNAINDAASWLTQPFHNMFNPKKHKTEILVNWGLAALVYVIAGNVVARVLRR